MQDRIDHPTATVLVTCRRCKNSHTPKVEYHGTRVFTRCPTCGYEIRLTRIPQPVKARHKIHASKKERLRRRWAGREAQRFAKLGGAA
jgi:uncharacterized Zn finger protein (UPF0148 family)